MPYGKRHELVDLPDCDDVSIYLSFNKYGHLFSCNGRGGGLSFGLVDFISVEKRRVKGEWNICLPRRQKATKAYT